MNNNRKNYGIFTVMLTLVLTIAGVFGNIHNSYAAVSEDKIVQLETVYFNNNVSNQAGKLLLKESPESSAGIKDELTKLIAESDEIITKNKSMIESLRPERANEAPQIKKLAESTFNNKVSQEAALLLLKFSPNRIKNIESELIARLNDAMAKTDKAEYTLNSLRGLKTITLVHINDVHGRAIENPDSKELGFSKLKTFFDYKNVNNNALLLNAGDTLHGTTFATISRGKSMIEIMNDMGFDAMVAGNHDFNYGYQELIELKNMADFPIMASNIVNDKGEQIFSPSEIVEIEGVKVGIFGLATEETKTKSSPLNTEGLIFLDPIETAKSEVENLKSNGAQVVILLSHLGIDEASDVITTDVVKAVEGIDVAIDGHSHTTLEEGLWEGKTLIAQTGAHSNNIGDVTILLDKDGDVKSKQAKLINYETARFINQNKEIEDKIESINSLNEEELKEIVGSTSVDLDGLRANVRTRETNLGNFIADAVLDTTGADVAITNGGGIRDSIARGDITVGDVLTVFPFTNYAVTLDLPGSVIKEALEYGLNEAPNEVGKFPQIAGMSVKYDSTRASGDRVIEILIKGEALDPNKTYTLATNDFMAIGGDGYEMFKDYLVTAEFELFSEIFENAIKKAGTISPEVDSRMEDISQSTEIKQAA